MGCNTLGLCPQNPGYHTLPPISLNNFSLGGPAGSESLRENTYQAQDNYSWTLGAHNLKFGGIFSWCSEIRSTWLIVTGGTSTAN